MTSQRLKRLRRSQLSVPGSSEKMLRKAAESAADHVFCDLEDAVAPDEKIRAREQVCAVVKGGGYGAREVVIRVNALETPWGTEDILAACDAEPDAILVPKVVHAGDVVSVAKILQGVHAPEKIRLWAMMETPMAILNARTIAAAAVYAENRLCCLVMGTNDLVKESRARALHDRFAVVPWLAMTLVAARAYRLLVEKDVDVPMRDGARLKADVFRPDDGGKFPAILNLGPYQKDKLWVPPHDLEEGPNPYMNWETVNPEWWVPRGYICLRLDEPGSGKSPGSLIA